MKRLPFAVALVALALSGCGGSRDYESINGRNAEKYIGSWSGTFGYSGEPASGTVTMTIARTRSSDSHVDVVGAIVDTEGTSTPLTGVIYDDPRVNDILTITRSGTSPTGGANTASLFGKAKFGKNGHLLIPHDPHVGGAPEGIIFFDFDLVAAS